MATVQTFTDQITAVSADVARVAALVTDLQAQIAAGGAITQADFDTLAAALATAQDNLAAIK